RSFFAQIQIADTFESLGFGDLNVAEKFSVGVVEGNRRFDRHQWRHFGNGVAAGFWPGNRIPDRLGSYTKERRNANYEFTACASPRSPKRSVGTPSGCNRIANL